MIKLNQNSKQTNKKSPTEKYYVLILGVCTGLAFILFLITLPDYGISYDELNLYEYADRMIDAYSKMVQGVSIDHLLDFYDLKFYGPSYLVLGRLLIYVMQWFFPRLAIHHAWHTVNFVLFLIAVWLVYGLTARLSSRKAAMFSALLFLTQPLLWGHGVMNLKDMPFLTAFLGAVTAGLKFGDILNKTQEGFIDVLYDLVHGIAIGIRHGWSIFLILLVLILIDRVFGNFLTYPIIQQVLVSSFDPSAETFLNRIVMSLVESGSALPVSEYIHKTMRLVNIAEFLLLFGFGIFIAWIGIKRASRAWQWLLIAGLICGIAFSIRVLGFAAGGLVALVIFWNQGKKVLPWMIVYSIVIAVTAYITWPYLWGDPIGRLLESIKVMAEFPWVGTVRFEGNNFPATGLPWYYLPKLISIQFTFPVIILSLLATVSIIQKVIQKTKGWKNQFLLLVWFWLPLMSFVLTSPAIYDNFRQMLFITPPLFVLSGFFVGEFMDKVGKQCITNLIIIASLVPGIAAGIWLHPYQYVYYNGLVGWTGNVQRQYETDYWGTSMCETAQYITDQTNKIAVVQFSDQVLSQLFEPCTTHPFDIRIIRDGNIQSQTDYAVLSSRFDSDLHNFVHLRVDHTIHRGKTIFSVVKVP